MPSQKQRDKNSFKTFTEDHTDSQGNKILKTSSGTVYTSDDYLTAESQFINNFGYYPRIGSQDVSIVYKYIDDLKSGKGNQNNPPPAPAPVAKPSTAGVDLTQQRAAAQATITAINDAYTAQQEAQRVSQEQIIQKEQQIKAQTAAEAARRAQYGASVLGLSTEGLNQQQSYFNSLNAQYDQQYQAQESFNRNFLSAKQAQLGAQQTYQASLMAVQNNVAEAQKGFFSSLQQGQQATQAEYAKKAAVADKQSNYEAAQATKARTQAFQTDNQSFMNLQRLTSQNAQRFNLFKQQRY